MEFEDHRAYQPGDDIRHLDRHVYARLGQHAIRQFALNQQMNVTVLLDCSQSMAFGRPTKLDTARRLTAMLAWIALAGSDRVRAGAFTGGRLKWHPVRTSPRQAASLFHWLGQLQPGGEANLKQIARLSAPRLLPGGMLIVISDWLSEDIDTALGMWRATGQEVVGIQVLSAEELEPELLGDGPVRMLDGETQEELTMLLSPGVSAQYSQVLKDWLAGIRRELHSRDGRHFLIRSDSNLERDVLPDWRSRGLVR